MLGLHLTVDARVNVHTAKTLLNDRGLMYDVIEKLSKMLNMTLVYPPLVASFPWANTELERYTEMLEDEGCVDKNEGSESEIVAEMRKFLDLRKNEQSGVSGTSIWLESHCTIHTWPEQQYFAADLFSCKTFDAKAASQLLIDTFKVEEAAIGKIIRSDKLQEFRMEKITFERNQFSTDRNF